MVPVRDGTRTAASPLKCGHPVPRKENPKGNNPGREGGRQRHPRRVHQDSRPVSSFCVLTFVGDCHTESPANSLREVNQVSLQLTAEGRGFPGDPYQFWGWCPSKFKRSRSSTAALWANSTSIYDRPCTTDLRPVVLKRDDRKYRQWAPYCVRSKSPWTIHEIKVSSKIRNPGRNLSAITGLPRTITFDREGSPVISCVMRPHLLWTWTCHLAQRRWLTIVFVPSHGTIAHGLR